MWNQFQIHIKLWSRAPNRNGSSSPRRRSHVWPSQSIWCPRDQAKVRSQILSWLGFGIGKAMSRSEQTPPQNDINKPLAKCVRHVAYERTTAWLWWKNSIWLTWWGDGRDSSSNSHIYEWFWWEKKGLPFKWFQGNLDPDHGYRPCGVEHLLQQCQRITG